MNVKMLTEALGGLLIILRPQAVVHSLPVLLATLIGVACLALTLLIVRVLNTVSCPHPHPRFAT